MVYICLSLASPHLTWAPAESHGVSRDLYAGIRYLRNLPCPLKELVSRTEVACSMLKLTVSREESVTPSRDSGSFWSGYQSEQNRHGTLWNPRFGCRNERSRLVL
jgi:hypothetical protein